LRCRERFCSVSDRRGELRGKTVDSRLLLEFAFILLHLFFRREHPTFLGDQPDWSDTLEYGPHALSVDESVDSEGRHAHLVFIEMP